MLTVLQHFTTEDQQQYIGDIFTLNFNLDKLVNGAPQVAAVEENKLKKVNVAGHYQRVRMHAIILYGALKDRLQKPNCPCKVCSVHLFSHPTTIVSFANYKSLWVRRYPIVLIYS